MIGFLKGQVSEVSAEVLLIDVQGVGYEVSCSLNTLSDYQTKLGETIFVWIYTHVREDAFTLYGFSSKNEKQFFLSLLKVNGIGPKMALNILSGASLDLIIERIEKEDVKALSSLPKVGKKTAEQMILTLKGKLVFSDEDKKLRSASESGTSPSHREVVSALVNLGFRIQEVEKTVGKFPKDIEFSEGVRQGLQLLSATT